MMITTTSPRGPSARDFFGSLKGLKTMIRERQVKGPLSTVNIDGKDYRVEYRRRYYEPGAHFTWIEVELAPGEWSESRDAIQTGCNGPYKRALTRQFVRDEVRRIVEYRRQEMREKFIADHFVFAHVGNEVSE